MQTNEKMKQMKLMMKKINFHVSQNFYLKQLFYIEIKYCKNKKIKKKSKKIFKKNNPKEFFQKNVQKNIVKKK